MNNFEEPGYRPAEAIFKEADPARIEQVWDRAKSELKSSLNPRKDTEGPILDGELCPFDAVLEIPGTDITISIINKGDNPKIGRANLRIEVNKWLNPADRGNPPQERTSYLFFKQPNGAIKAKCYFRILSPGETIESVLPASPSSDEQFVEGLTREFEGDPRDKAMGVDTLYNHQLEELIAQMEEGQFTEDPWHENNDKTEAREEIEE